MNNTPFPILYAEDDEEDRFLFLEGVREANENVSVVTVENGTEVLDYLLQISEPHQLPSAIVSDLHMPLCDGWDVLRMIKQHPEWRQIPVVIFSTSSSRAEITAAQHMGADAFFSKPGTYQEVIAIVQKIIGICKQFRPYQT
ncbi:MAG TPA: response regulator [Flavisolibacter sp.]|nr:response regulator [Flavisolibacter sp.]